MILWTGSKNKIASVGLLGNGTMGQCMLGAMLDEGYKVVVYDPSLKAQEHAISLGAEIADTPNNLAKRCNLIIMSLPKGEHVVGSITGEFGLLDALTSDHLIIDTSTVSPDTSREMAKIVAGYGTLYLDAPILGRPSATGKWLLPIGGSKEAIEWAEPVLKTFAGTLSHVGDQGSGNALKLLNQIMFGAINAISCEVMAICDHVGIDKEVFYNTVASSGAATVSGLFKEVGKNIVNNDYHTPTFTLDLLIKDLGLGLEMSKENNAPSILGSAVQIFNEIATSSGLGTQDTSALYKVFSRNYRKED